MKDVGVREFRDHASSYLSGSEPLAVRRHGRVVGFYLPVKQKSDDEELEAALRDLGESLAEIRHAAGLSEDELVEALAPPESESRDDQATGV
jgi:hypothetical protein